MDRSFDDDFFSDSRDPFAEMDRLMSRHFEANRRMMGSFGFDNDVGLLTDDYHPRPTYVNSRPTDVRDRSIRTRSLMDFSGLDNEFQRQSARPSGQPGYSFQAQSHSYTVSDGRNTISEHKAAAKDSTGRQQYRMRRGMNDQSYDVSGARQSFQDPWSRQDTLTQIDDAESFEREFEQKVGSFAPSRRRIDGERSSMHNLPGPGGARSISSRRALEPAHSPRDVSRERQRVSHRRHTRNIRHQNNKKSGKRNDDASSSSR
eukprot:632177_1